MKSFIVRLISGCAILITGGVLTSPTSLAGFPLPDLEEIPPMETMAIDGTWRITANNSRMRIEQGRGYAVDSWKVIFKGVVEPGKVALRNIIYLGQGSFRGEDLTLSGNFSAKIQPNGDLKFQVGLIPYVLTPVELDDPIEYIGLMTQAGFDAKDSPYLSNWILAEKAKRDARQEIGGGEAAETGQTPPDESIEDGEAVPEQPPSGDGDVEVIDPEAGEGDAEVIDPEAGDGDAEVIEPDPGEGDEVVVDPEPGKGEEEFVEEDPGGPKLAKVEATVHGKVKKKKRSCKGKDVYLSQGACYRCPNNYKRASLTRKMDHPQACQKRGLPQHKYARAKYVGKARPIAGCPGKEVYRSDGGCYSCPKGFKRASVARKMTHAQACQERGLPEHTYTRAERLFNLDTNVLPCPNGQFAHKGYCKSCPAGTLRFHYLGLDTGYCIAKDEPG